jgi:hypothetical protein
MKTANASGPSKPRNSGWGALAQYNNTAKYRNSEVIDTDTSSQAGYERKLFDATKLYAGHEDKAQIYPFWKVWIDPTLANEVATLQTNLENYIQQSSLQFITGSKNIDTDWDAAFAQIRSLTSRPSLVVVLTAQDAPEAARGFLGSLPRVARGAHVLVGTVTDAAPAVVARPDVDEVYREASGERAARDAAIVAAAISRAGGEAIADTPEDLPPRIADRYLALKAAGRL